MPWRCVGENERDDIERWKHTAVTAMMSVAEEAVHQDGEKNHLENVYAKIMGTCLQNQNTGRFVEKM